MCGCKPYNEQEMLAAGYHNNGVLSCGHIDWIDLKVVEHNPVNHPKHYASEAKCSGCGESIEAIDVIRHLGFNIGNAMKYLWRAGKKDDIVQDLKKAVWYIQDQIAMLEGQKNPNVHRLSKTDKMYENAMTHVIGHVDSMTETDEGFEVKWIKTAPPFITTREEVETGLATGKYIRENLAEMMEEEQKVNEILRCEWSDNVPKLGPAAYQFHCDTHNFFMLMPIDKAPERCDGVT